MYESFYGFTEKPFNITPDPKFLFLSKKHQEAISHLLYGIQERGGFIVITGEIGTGKTILCRYLLNQLDERTDGAVILNPNLSELELLKAINEDFGIRSTATTKKALIDELNAFLLKRRLAGQNMVLVIDEAQSLAPGVLEQIRLLSNLETEKEKLIQIILLGQPELRDLLARPDLRQLNQRVTARYHLMPLAKKEAVAYIRHRMGVAGNPNAATFTGGALRQIYAFSRGTPRLTNVLCDRLLLAGFAANTRRLTSKMVRQAVREVAGAGRRPPVTPWRPAQAAVLAAVALMCLGAGWVASTMWSQGQAQGTATPATLSPLVGEARADAPSGPPEASAPGAAPSAPARAEQAALMSVPDPSSVTETGMRPRRHKPRHNARPQPNPRRG